jgi:hypothetical protein
LSYDLDIATHQKPERIDIDDALPDGATVSAVFGAEGGLVMRCDDWSCEIEGPFECAPEDLGQALASAVIAPRWLLQIHVPLGASKSAREAVVRVATHVARTRSGAVFDPQRDRIVFPKGGKRTAPAKAAAGLIRTLKCEWCYAPGVLANQAEQFLSLVSTFLPEAMPVRFGGFEPLQYRLEGGRDRFIEMWKTESSSSGHFFWTCKRPGLGGGADWPFDNEANAERGGVAAAKLRAELQGDALSTDGQWRAAVSDFFRAVSDRTQAFYARATLSPSAPSQLTAGEHDRIGNPSAVFRGRWHGVPRHPAWLTWLGRDYSASLASALAESTDVSPEPGRLFVQDQNLDSESTLLPEAPPPPIFRVQLGVNPPAAKETLGHNVAFLDAEWLPLHAAKG